MDTFDIRDRTAFLKLVPSRSRLQRLATGMQFTEGPVWSPSGGFLVFSDIPADEMKRWSARDGLSTFRKPSQNSNGNTRDRSGRLLSCHHGSRVLTRTERDGSVTVLASHYEEKRLNSPNDVVVKSDGAIYFTDPPYGLRSPAEKEQPHNYVFRLDPRTGDLRPLIADFDMPNGLCFSPDEKLLYVADSGKPRHIRVFTVDREGSLKRGKEFCRIDNGVPDGIRCDGQGNVWSSAGDGVQIFAPTGKLIGKILAPETPANLCFGGADRRTLFITAQTSLYSIRVGPAVRR